MDGPRVRRGHVASEEAGPGSPFALPLRAGAVQAERTFSGPESGQPSEQEPAAEPDPQASDPEAPEAPPLADEVAVLSKRQRQRLRQRKGKESREKLVESQAKEEAKEKEKEDMEAKVGGSQSAVVGPAG